MTTVTLHPPVGAGPQAMAQMTRTLVALAQGDRGRVRSGRGGLVVDDALALAYLASRPGAEVPPPAPPAPMPGGIARLVRNAEERGGLAQPEGEHKPAPTPTAEAPTPAPATTTTTEPVKAPAGAKPAARRRRVAARPEEQA